jgi:hypothetical protein
MGAVDGSEELERSLENRTQTCGSGCQPAINQKISTGAKLFWYFEFSLVL